MIFFKKNLIISFLVMVFFDILDIANAIIRKVLVLALTEL